MRDKIWDYVKNHLKDFELEGVEIAEEDIAWIQNRIDIDNISLETACDECLQDIRDILDEGLEDEEEEYTFGFKVTGCYTVKVNAKSYEEAKALAENEICNVDFGRLENISSEIIDCM